MGLMARGRAALATRLQTAAGMPLTYIPADGGDPAGLTGWPGDVRAAADPHSPTAPARFVRGDVDWVIPASELARIGVAEPQAGDRVVEADLTSWEVYPPDGEPCWRWSDPGRTLARVKTQTAAYDPSAGLGAVRWDDGSAALWDDGAVILWG